MDKAQLIHNFWNSFGVSAYDENTVPDNAVLPYITYEFQSASFNERISLSASIWDKSNSWKTVTELSNKIDVELIGGKIISKDNISAWILKGTPFAQRMADENDNIRRIVLLMECEFNEL